MRKLSNAVSKDPPKLADALVPSICHISLLVSLSSLLPYLKVYRSDEVLQETVRNQCTSPIILTADRTRPTVDQTNSLGFSMDVTCVLICLSFDIAQKAWKGCEDSTL